MHLVSKVMEANSAIYLTNTSNWNGNTCAHYRTYLYALFSQDYNLVSHTTFVVFVNFYTWVAEPTV